MLQVVGVFVGGGEVAERSIEATHWRPVDTPGWVLVPARNSRYPEIAALLRARILDGEWTPGNTLPTLDALAAEYGADKNTISRAISEILEPEGLVWAVPKRGTIVRHGMVRPHRMRGNLVKRNPATQGPRGQRSAAQAPRHRPGSRAAVPGQQLMDPPRVADIPGVAGQAPGPGDWLYRIEKAGHGPL
jgi:DNA-binding transcriptional regulator YhcF (GntR family)